MSQTPKVRLPIPDVLIVNSVDHMLAQDVVRLMGIRLMGQEIRRDKICFVNGGPFVSATDSREHLVSQPSQIRFQVTENHGRSEVSRERFVPMQEMFWIPAYRHINRIKQSLQVTVLIKR